MTIDVPGPVNSTIVNVDKVDAKRCRYCNSVAPYLIHPKAKEEFDARKRRKREKNLKKFGLVFGILFGVLLLGRTVNYVNNQMAINKVVNETADGNKKLEEVRANWQSVSDSCGLGVSVEVVKTPDKYQSPQVDVHHTVDSSSEFANFWTTEKGKALDCFSRKIYGVTLSSKFTYSQDQVKGTGFINDSFYDYVGNDGATYPGKIGKADEHLDGFMNYSEDDDYVFIYLNWELDKNWSRY
jgi:hypothetical protein